MPKSRKITDLNQTEAKEFFLDEKNYVNFDLPDYFHFDELLKTISDAINGLSFKDLCKENDEGGTIYPKNYERINYTILNNKDGSFAWRPLQLIHPVLYVDLVNLLTEESNWAILKQRFDTFSKGRIECISIPRISDEKAVSNKAAQINHWWEEVEQRSIKLSLKYSYIFSTDILNCYPSIYTHTIEWALESEGKEEVKRRRKTGENVSNLGSKIDQKLQNMNYGQTNGIPQGSTLMDFIAETVLGYGDVLLTKALEEKLSEEDFNNFHIIRYRDDYKIFVNNPTVGHEILIEISKVLHVLNMKMSPEKTSENSDIIFSSIKKEKMERICAAPFPQHYQKEALRIYQTSKKYPNAGLVAKELNVFYDQIENKENLEDTDIEVLIAIISMIGVSSPGLINWVSAIISKLLDFINEEEKVAEIIKMIHKKFEKVPNTSFIDVWLQRISASLNIDLEYKDTITDLGISAISNSEFWECSWLQDSIIEQLDSVSVSTLKSKVESQELPSVISREEVELFRLFYDL